jgi:hypothetical protein
MQQVRQAGPVPARLLIGRNLPVYWVVGGVIRAEATTIQSEAGQPVLCRTQQLQRDDYLLRHYCYLERHGLVTPDPSSIVGGFLPI